MKVYVMQSGNTIVAVCETRELADELYGKIESFKKELSSPYKNYQEQASVLQQFNNFKSLYFKDSFTGLGAITIHEFPIISS